MSNCAKPVEPSTGLSEGFCPSSAGSSLLQDAIITHPAASKAYLVNFINLRWVEKMIMINLYFWISPICRGGQVFIDREASSLCRDMPWHVTKCKLHMSVTVLHTARGGVRRHAMACPYTIIRRGQRFCLARRRRRSRITRLGSAEAMPAFFASVR